jgi:hypothetical protein
LFWPIDPERSSPDHQQSQHISLANQELLSDGYNAVCQMYRYIPLHTPVMLPFALQQQGFQSFRKLFDSPLGPTVDLSWTNHPLIVELTNACKNYPNMMSTHWISRSWIKEAITKSSLTPGLEHPCNCDLWIQTERTLAFRLHHDFLLTRIRLSSTVKKS